MILTLGVRLFYSLSEQEFSTGSSYFIVRQVEHIATTGAPMYHDALSVGGRIYSFSPLYVYVLSGFWLLSQHFMMLKIVSEILLILLIPLCYAVAYRLTKHMTTSLLIAAVAGFTPFLYLSTLNELTMYSLALPLHVYLIWIFMDIKKPRAIPMFIAGFMVLMLTHPSVFLFLAAAFLSMLLLWVADQPLVRREIELLAFSLFFGIWFHLILYKDVLLKAGVGFFWQNLPEYLLRNAYTGVNIFEMIYLIGVLPCLFAAFVFYRYLFREQGRNLYLLISYALVVLILLWLRLLPANVGLTFLSIVFVLMSAAPLKTLFELFPNMKSAVLTNLFTVLLIVIFFMSSLIPALYYADTKRAQAISPEELQGYAWMREHLPQDAVVASSREEGPLLNYYGIRSVVDPDFLLITDSSERYEKIRTLYHTTSITEALRIMQEFRITHILMSQRAQREYDMERLAYTQDPCFKLISTSGGYLYERVCILEERS